MRPINAAFTRLLYGEAISSIGTFVFDTTLVLWIGVKLLAGSPYAAAAVSGVLIAAAVGTFAVGPFAGVFVDRWSKQRTMLASDLIRSVLVAVLIVIALLPSGWVPVGLMLALIYAVVFLTSAIGQFFNPSAFAFTGDIVPGDADRARASSLIQTASYVAAIVGPPLAAPLLFTTGVYWALIINALSFLVSFVAVRGIRVPPTVAAEAPALEITASESGGSATAEGAPAHPAAGSDAAEGAKPGYWGELAEGFRFVARTRLVRVLIVCIVVATLGTGALNALDVFFVSENLHVNPHWYGTLGMGYGIGAVVGTLAAGWLCRKFSDSRVFYVAMIVLGVGLAIYARLGNLVIAIILLALLGIPEGAVNVALSPIVLRTVPRELLGRVVAVVNPLQNAASVISALLAGWLASTVMLHFHHHFAGFTFGRIDTIFMVSGALIVIAGVYASVGLRGTGVRPVPRPRSGEPDEAGTASAAAEPAPASAGGSAIRAGLGDPETGATAPA